MSRQPPPLARLGSMQSSQNPTESTVPFIPPELGEITAPEAPLGLLDDGDYADGGRAEGGDNLFKVDHRPWHKKPSPWWLFPVTGLASMLVFATIAPRTELYIHLACAIIRPEYSTYPVFVPTPPLQGLDDSKILGSFAFSAAAIPTGMLITYPSPQHFMPSSNPHVNFTAFTSEPDQRTNLPTVPSVDKRCSSDPKVQAAVAQLSTIMSTSLGILSCLTTGWWSRLSDRYGRVRILGLTVIGALLSDLNFIFVAFKSAKVPGGFRFLLVGPILDGLFGGMTTASALAHAYISDCTDPHSRAKAFSQYMGLLFVGMSVGPTLGSLVINYTNNLLSVFYLSFAGHLLYAFMVWFVIPESLSAETMKEIAARRQEEAKLEQAQLDGELANIESEHARRRTLVLRKMKRIALKPLVFLRPMLIFLPRLREVGEIGYGKSRDWSLTFIAASYAATLLLMGSYQFKFQYAINQFGWNSQILGYWLTVIGVLRAFHLIVFLPAAIRFFTPRSQPVALPTSPSEPLISDRTNVSTSDPTTSTTSSNSTGPPRHHRSTEMDLFIARLSITNELIAYTLAALSIGPRSWGGSIVLSSFSGGFTPAMQSLALALFTSGKSTARKASGLGKNAEGEGGHETGTLFGGLSVLQVISSQVIGPALFGVVYIQTVATFPKAMFLLSVGLVAFAVISLSLVRLPKHEEGADASVPTPNTEA